MHQKVGWLVEGRVIHIDVAGDYEIEMVRRVVAAAKPLVDASTAPMHVIWDVSRLTNMTRDLREPINEMHVVRYHPKIGWITLITRDVMLRFAGQIVSRFLGANYRAVTSFDEAVATLCEIEPGLITEFQKIAVNKAG